jgi:Zn-dependent peptidase ImmA (M78 family)
MKKPQIRTDDAPGLTSDEIVETLLAESGVTRKLPTDEQNLLRFLGLKQLSFDFMAELGFVDGEDQPVRNLRAALSRNEKVVAIHSNLRETRGKFSTLHEIAHFILPEHHEKLFLDNDDTLSWWTRLRLEQEANGIAADLLFQGRRFESEAVGSPLSWQTILKLAPQYGASYEATARRYAERHVQPCALVVYDKITKTNEVDFEEDLYRLQYTIASKPFQKQFFRRLHGDPNRFPASELYKPKYWGEVTEKEFIVGNDDHSKWHFETEVFSNGYKIFQLIKRETQPM